MAFACLWVGGGASSLGPTTLRAQAPLCAPDAALTEASTTLLVDGTEPTRASLSAALRAAGSDLPSVRLLRAPLADARARARFFAAVMEGADAPLVCGEAESESTRVLLVAARGGRLDVEEASGADVRGGADGTVSVDTDRGAHAGAASSRRLRLRVSLDRRFRDAYLAGRDAEDRLHRWAVDEDVLRHGFELPADLPRPVVVQLVGSGPDGPRPLSRRVLADASGEGQRVAGSVVEELSVDGDDDLATRVGTLRAHEGVRDLRVNRLLGAEAAAHAQRVCSTGRVRHQGLSGDADDPRARLRRRGIEARVVGETVARGGTLQAALSALSESPSHRMTLVDPRFTDVGFGTVRGPSGTCVVALFAAWPRYVPR